MTNFVYLTLNGYLQGLISAGCSSLDSIGNKATADYGAGA